MSDEFSTLARIAALSTVMLEALDELDRQFASEALTAELRQLGATVHAELERRAQAH
jgi:hypothetical protein